MTYCLPGEFKVQLPDGRVQVTSYEADDYGYRPIITYLYPEHIDKKKVEKLKPKVNNEGIS